MAKAPTKKQIAEDAKAEAIARLKTYLKPGDTVYCILRHVSRSGMMRVIDLKCISGPDCAMLHIGFNAAIAAGNVYDRKNEGIRIGGCGMDMGFALVSELAWHLFQDEGKLLHRWI